MPAATLPILANICVAGMFVGSFLTIAQLNPGFRHVRWIALCFAVGLITPIADFLLPHTSWPVFLTIVSDCGVFFGIVLMAPALSMLYGRRPPWIIAAAMTLGGSVLRAIIWDGPRSTLWYEFAYQTPFALAALFCAVVIVRHGHRTMLDHVACGLFAAVSLHFLIKPFIAAHFGSGANATEYADTTYAMISQASSGLLLVAAGLMVLINAFQLVIQRDRAAAHTDALTGLPNRRALTDAFETLTSRSADDTTAVAIIDLDHFKAVNDLWGHEAGDEVLRAVAQCLDENRPASASVFRLGGEEFVLLLPRGDAELVHLVCEKLRVAVSQLAIATADVLTVSIGATMIAHQEDMFAALRRADHGLYAAKAAGRNQTVLQLETAHAIVPDTPNHTRARERSLH